MGHVVVCLARNAYKLEAAIHHHMHARNAITPAEMPAAVLIKYVIWQIILVNLVINAIQYYVEENAALGQNLQYIAAQLPEIVYAVVIYLDIILMMTAVRLLIYHHVLEGQVYVLVTRIHAIIHHVILVFRLLKPNNYMICFPETI